MAKHTIKLPTGDIQKTEFRLGSRVFDRNGRQIFEGDRVTVHVDELEEYFRRKREHCNYSNICDKDCDDGLVGLLRQALKDGSIVVAFNDGSLDLCLDCDIVNAPWILCPIQRFAFGRGKYLEVVEDANNVED